VSRAVVQLLQMVVLVVVQIQGQVHRPASSTEVVAGDRRPGRDADGAHDVVAGSPQHIAVDVVAAVDLRPLAEEPLAEASESLDCYPFDCDPEHHRDSRPGRRR